MKKITILGSTGSIGRQTLAIVRAHPERLKVEALAAGGKDLELLTQQILEFEPTLVAVSNKSQADELYQRLSKRKGMPSIVFGQEGLIEAACAPEAETVVTGLVGFLGVRPTAAAISKGKTIALANKETLVAAGAAIMPMLAEHNARIVPVDSEHSAIHQALSGYDSKDIRHILLTASGGPFRTWDKKRIDNATVDDALKHPNWSMGQKITIDSATLMNKGLEIIEARWLFNVRSDQIRVVVHPQSIIHSAVEFVDNSIVAQMGLPDMRLPIHYALFWPERVASNEVPRLDLVKLAGLTFEEPDEVRFPCLALARQVASEDNTLPCVLNAANEVAVEAFLKGAIKFSGISELIERVLHQHKPIARPSLDDIFEADKWSRVSCHDLIGAAAK